MIAKSVFIAQRTSGSLSGERKYQSIVSLGLIIVFLMPVSPLRRFLIIERKSFELSLDGGFWPVILAVLEVQWLLC